MWTNNHLRRKKICSFVFNKAFHPRKSCLPPKIQLIRLESVVAIRGFVVATNRFACLRVWIRWFWVCSKSNEKRAPVTRVRPARPSEHLSWQPKKRSLRLRLKLAQPNEENVYGKTQRAQTKGYKRKTSSAHGRSISQRAHTRSASELKKDRRL